MTESCATGKKTVSPSPTVSPDQVYSNLPVASPSYDSPALSNNYVVAEPATPSSNEYDDNVSEAPRSKVTARPFEYSKQLPRKRQRVASDDEDSRTGSPLDSGESEREEDGDDAEDDDEYRPDARESRTSSRRKAAAAKSQAARSVSPQDSTRPRLAPPVPVPNLTKKSRGRRVPTTAVLVSQNGIEKVRSHRLSRPPTDPHSHVRSAEYPWLQVQGPRVQQVLPARRASETPRSQHPHQRET